MYESDKQKYMLSATKSDEYDPDALKKSLDAIRDNVISHKINAKFIVPTSINMEDGIKSYLNNK